MTDAAAMDPWSWLPSREPWFQKISDRAAEWSPDPTLGLDRPRLSAAVQRAARAQEDWLLHPCVSALTIGGAGSEDRRRYRDLQLAAWTAAHCREPLGTVTIDAPEWVYTRAGGHRLAAGVHELEEVGRQSDDDDWPVGISLDVWCRSIGLEMRNSWSSLGELTPLQEEQLQADIVKFLRAMSWAETVAPYVGRWLAAATKIAVPLYHDPRDDEFHSGSSDDLPGLVHLDLFGGEALIMEALVHETAHRHLYLAEAGGPLVDPECRERYRSPLRPDLRPLRGILMALHALAYICCYYREAAATQMCSPSRLESEMPGLIDALADARATVTTNRHHLTDAGNRFLDLTLDVALTAQD